MMSYMVLMMTTLGPSQADITVTDVAGARYWLAGCVQNLRETLHYVPDELDVISLMLELQMMPQERKGVKGHDAVPGNPVTLAAVVPSYCSHDEC